MPARSSFLYGNSANNTIGSTNAVTGTGYYYRYREPNGLSTGQKFPVIIWLHWAGNEDRGGTTRNEQNLNAAYEVNVPALQSTDVDGNAATYPCFLVIPQGSLGSSETNTWLPSYNTSGTRYGGGTPNSTSGTPMQALENIINTLTKQYPGKIDLDRVILTGISAGGFGSYQLPVAQNYGGGGLNLFSCTVPVSGAAVGSHQYPLNLPLWVFHAADDNTLKIPNEDDTVSDLREAGKQVVYTRYNSGGHTVRSWLNAYADPQLLSWMFAQRRGHSNKFNASPYLGVYGAAKGATVTATGTAKPDNDFTNVGWASDLYDATITGTDGQTTGTTPAMVSGQTFTSALIGDRIAIADSLGINQTNNCPLYYDITNVPGAHTLTVQAIQASPGNLDNPPARNSSLPGLLYSIYPPGASLNPVTAPSGGGVTTTFYTLPSMPLSPVLQSIGESPDNSISPKIHYSSSDGIHETGDYGEIGGVRTVNQPIILGTSPTTGNAPAVAYSTITSAEPGSTAIDISSTHFATITSSKYTAVSLTGTATGNGGATISSVQWKSNVGYFGTASGTTGTSSVSWTITSLRLVPGDNILTVTTTDSLGNVAYNNLDVTYSPYAISDAGYNQTLSWPSQKTITLHGSYSTTLTNITSQTYSWFLVSSLSSGPSVSIANAGTATPTVTFNQPGTYLLRQLVTITGKNANNQTITDEEARGDVTVTVVPNGSVVTAVDCGTSSPQSGYVADTSSTGANGSALKYIITHDGILPTSANQTAQQTYRTGTTTSSDLTYNVSVPNNNPVDVVLHFVEPNQQYNFGYLRQFTVNVNSTALITNLDLGGATSAFDDYQVVAWNVTPVANKITIQLTHGIDFPVISSIVVQTHVP